MFEHNAAREAIKVKLQKKQNHIRVLSCLEVANLGLRQSQVQQTVPEE